MDPDLRGLGSGLEEYTTRIRPTEDEPAMHFSRDYTDFFDIHDAGPAAARQVRDDFTTGASELLARLGVVAGEADRIAAELWSRMTEPGRHYHTAVHVLGMFQRAKRMDVELSDVERLAVWFHDTIYDAQAPPGESEARSAEWMREMIIAADVPGEIADRAAGIIRATAHHLEDESHAEHRLVLDLDVAGLASDERTFARQSHAIRAEFRHLSDEQYQRGRTAFFRDLLDRERIYRTPRFAGLEEAARSRIRREIEPPPSPL